MKLILASAFMVMVSLAGCTKDEVKAKACDSAKLASTIVAAQVALELSCKNVTAIIADMEKGLVDAKVCEKPEVGTLQARSAIGEVVCAPMVDVLFAGVLAKIPSSWECSGGKLAADAKVKLVAACAKAI